MWVLENVSRACVFWWTLLVGCGRWWRWGWHLHHQAKLNRADLCLYNFHLRNKVQHCCICLSPTGLLVNVKWEIDNLWQSASNCFFNQAGNEVCPETITCICTHAMLNRSLMQAQHFAKCGEWPTWRLRRTCVVSSQIILKQLFRVAIHVKFV